MGKRIGCSRLWLSVAWLTGLMMLTPGAALAFDWSLKFEPGFAVAISPPQNQLFEVGGAAMAKVLFGVGRYVDVGPTVGVIGLPAIGSKDAANLGVGWLIGGGFRFKRPYDLGIASPWLDADLLYVRTGLLDRFGIAVAAGVSFPLGETRKFWIGPFIRYSHIIQQPKRSNYNNRDAKMLIAGLSFELGNSRLPPRRPEKPILAVCPAPPKPTVCETCKPAPVCETCKLPPPPRVEISEMIQFDWDSTVIRQDMYSKLDNVVRLMKKDSTASIIIKGHASLEGQDEHNQILSENRALAVLNHLVDQGISPERIVIKGFGSTDPLESNDTLKGRVANRRAKISITVLDGGTR